MSPINARMIDKEVRLKTIREFVLNEHGGNVSAAARTLHGVVSKTTLTNIINNKPVSENMICAIELAMSLGSEQVLRDTLASSMQIEANPDNEDPLRWKGMYHYFRWRQVDTVDKESLEYNYGAGRILVDGDIFQTFEHWSANFPFDLDEPEHRGVFFANKDNVYMLGAAKNVLRLGMAENVTNPKTELIKGIILSQMKTDRNRPFASRFLMIHENAIDNFAELKSREYYSNEPGQRTVGENKFRDLTERYVHFMLSRY